jgi:BirA family biotin operon repressor/biotin-[acetyl-CoA-carboxylase] ligase
VVDSTNERARLLAAAGAPHGTLVTAGEQTAGRGRQGRRWTAPAGRALLMSLVLRQAPPLLPIAAAVAVAEIAGPQARVKWPNDVLVEGRKVAGILVEGRPQAGWWVLGIGINVALSAHDLPEDLRDRAGGLGRPPSAVEPTLKALLAALARQLHAPPADILAAVRARDVLRGRPIAWDGGAGVAHGIDDAGRLLVTTPHGPRRLEAGEVHLAAGVPQ